jgi:teichuronic acid biosynthesis glycosyltransferase TuaG
MEKELVSIITPCFNSSEYIIAAIDSVRQQTYQKWEMIITDDYSSDNTCEIIETYIEKDVRIKLYRSDKNRGAAAARNNSLKHTNGQYVAFLDSDDVWVDDKLAKQLAFIRGTGAAISFTVYREMSENGDIFGKFIDTGSPAIISYKDMLKKAATMGCLTIMVDLSKTGDLRMLDVKTGQDYALWLSILKRSFHAYKLNECLAYYRIRSNSISRNKVKKVLSQWRIYRESEQLSFVCSAWCFGHYAWRAMNRR